MATGVILSATLPGHIVQVFCRRAASITGLRPRCFMTKICARRRAAPAPRNMPGSGMWRSFVGSARRRLGRALRRLLVCAENGFGKRGGSGLLGHARQPNTKRVVASQQRTLIDLHEVDGW